MINNKNVFGDTKDICRILNNQPIGTTLSIPDGITRKIYHLELIKVEEEIQDM